MFHYFYISWCWKLVSQVVGYGHLWCYFFIFDVGDHKVLSFISALWSRIGIQVIQEVLMVTSCVIPAVEWTLRCKKYWKSIIKSTWKGSLLFWGWVSSPQAPLPVSNSIAQNFYSVFTQNRKLILPFKLFTKTQPKDLIFSLCWNNLHTKQKFHLFIVMFTVFLYCLQNLIFFSILAS